MMSDAKRLHPITILFNMLNSIKRLLFLFIVLLLTDGFSIYFFIFFAIILGVAFAFGFIAWRRFSYSVTDDALYLEYGIFKRTKRTISKNRIQSIDLTETIVHRMFNLVKVQIETAGGGPNAEASLQAVTLVEGSNLREVLKNGVGSKEEVKEKKQFTIKKITMPRLAFAGLTSGGVGIVLGFFVAVLLEFEDLVSEKMYNRVFEWLSSTSIFILLLLGLILVTIIWLLGVLWVMIRYGGFTIKRMDNELLITRGLLERKQVTIPLHRIQAIGIEENIFRQPFGYATVFAEIAGSRAEGELLDSTVLFPLLHKREIPNFVRTFLKEFSFEEEQLRWKKPTERAIPFYLIRSSFIFLLAGLVVYAFFPKFVWIPITFFVLSIILGWFNYKDAGYILMDERLIIRYRFIKRVTIQLYHNRIQAFEKRQNAFQKKLGLASMQVSIIHNLGGRHIQTKDIDEEQINKINETLSYKKESRIKQS